MLASAVVLVLSGSLLLGRRVLVVAGAVVLLLAVPPGAVRGGDGLVFEDESRYQFVRVTENDGVRRLYLNEGVAVHSVWRDDTVLTGGVWDTFLAVPLLLGQEPARAAILGNAGGTVARAFGTFYPGVEVDGVEIDPVVTDVAYRFFGLAENPRLTTYDEDARPFLRRIDRRYDLVYVDAYHQPYVPFYLATREFFELVRSRLRPGGLVALNVATVPATGGSWTSSRARSRVCSPRCGSGRCSSSTTSSSGSPSRSPASAAPPTRGSTSSRPSCARSSRSRSRRPDGPGPTTTHRWSG